MNNLFTLLHFYTISINKKIHKNVDKITKKNIGNYLFSLTLSSAYKSLTSVFGMGTGVSS